MMTQRGSRQFVQIVLGLALLGILWFGTARDASAAAILYVNAATGSDSHSGTSWGTAYKTLAKALSVAVSGDQIWVAKGTYQPKALTNPTDPLSATFTLKNGVAIYGGFAGTESSLSQRHWKTNPTILSGNIGDPNTPSDNAYHVVFGTSLDHTAILDGFTITAGNASGILADYEGAGLIIYSSFSSGPILRNLTISNNTARVYGGGMYTDHSSPVLVNVVFTGNYAGAGGGMYNVYSAFGGPTLNHVIFTSNHATSGDGGGMYNFDNSSPKLKHVTFSGNTATSNGGGMYNDGNSSPTLRDVSFYSNFATYGGGMYNTIYSTDTTTPSNPTLTNVVFSGNSVNGQGAGIYNNRSSPTLTDVTLSGNQADSDGAGIYNNINSNPTLTNVTIAANVSTNAGGAGMSNNSSTPVLNNVTFSGNTPGGGSTIGGMYNYGSSPNIYNSIFWNDGSTEIYDTPSPASAPFIINAVIGGGCPTGANCSNAINSDPVLGALQNNGGFTQTMALGAGSSAIDQGGVYEACTSHDQRGVARPQGNACDIGAYEVRAQNFSSQAAYDGWVLESGQGTHIGGSLSSTTSTVRVGDDAKNRQYRSLLSFDTSSLPDGATAVKSTIAVDIQATAGQPLITLGNLLIDIRRPYFGSSLALASSDFQASANLFAAGTFSPTLGTCTGLCFLGDIDPLGLPYINKTGTTQLRLRFTSPSDLNNAADYLSLYSGNYATASAWPMLTVYYNP